MTQRSEYQRQKNWGVCSCSDESKAETIRYGLCTSGSCPHAWKPGTWGHDKRGNRKPNDGRG